MPDRFLRESLLTSRWAHVSMGAQTLYTRLLLKVCDYGLYEADPKLLAGVCYPVGHRAWPRRIDAMLKELAEADLILLYEVNGKRYLQIKRWRERPRTIKARFPFPGGQFVADFTEIPLASRVLTKNEKIYSEGGNTLVKVETFSPTNPINTGLSPTTVQPTSHDLPKPKPKAQEPKPLPIRGNGGRGFYKPGGF